MYYQPGLTFFICAGLAVAVFIFGVYEHVMIWTAFRAEPLIGMLRWRKALRSLITEGLVQRQILRMGFYRWAAHVSMSMGFLGLFVQTSFLFFLDHIIPAASDFHRFIVEGQGRYVLDVWGDFFGTLLLLGLLMAAARRYILRPVQIETLFEDTVTIFFLLIVTVTGFLTEAARLALTPPATENWYSFLGYLMALPMRGLMTKEARADILYAHIFLSLSFIAYVPYSKAVHMILAPLAAAMNSSMGLFPGGRVVDGIPVPLDVQEQTDDIQAAAAAEKTNA